MCDVTVRSRQTPTRRRRRRPVRADPRAHRAHHRAEAARPQGYAGDGEAPHPGHVVRPAAEERTMTMGALEFDPQVLAELAPLLAAKEAAGAAPPVGDVASRRVANQAVFTAMAAGRPAVTGIDVSEYTLRRDDGATVTMTWYRRASGEQPGSAALYLHGGGMILSLAETRDLYDSAVRGYVADSGVPMLMVDYRVADRKSTRLNS